MPDQVGFLIWGNFTSIQGLSTTYVFSYFIDPPPIIHGEQMDLDPIASVILQVDLCTTAFNPKCRGHVFGDADCRQQQPSK